MVAALISRSPSRRLDTLGGLTRLSLLDFMEWMWHSHLGSPDSLVRLAVIHCLHEKQHSVPCSQNSTDYRHFSYVSYVSSVISINCNCNCNCN